MPDLSNLMIGPLSALPIHRSYDATIASSSSTPVETLEGDPDPEPDRRLRLRISNRGTCSAVKKERVSAEGKGRTLEDHVRAWVERKMADGVEERECELPFLTGASKLAECRECNRYVYPGEQVLCSVRGCQEAYHVTCAKKRKWKTSAKEFKCLQHACFICKKTPSRRCVRCTNAWHDKCSPWPGHMLQYGDHSGNRQAVCWGHTIDWQHDKKHPDRTSNIEEAFQRLPLPYFNEDFKIGSILTDVTQNNTEPCPYVHIRRNVYLVKKRRDGAEADVGCTKCRNNSTCRDDCECRGLSVSCSKACHCSDMCTNRPFRKEKKIKVIKTEACGWGVVALEALEKGDFVIEYIGEVINDALCEQRLWDMKYRGDQNFYMCEVRKDFTIDATFKGNTARFLNHSCDPNCKLEKWQVDGETRVGVFASRSIEVGEPLTYDYRFVHFGTMVKCFCGAQNCQGFLGSKRKTNQLSCWGCKKKRTSILRA
ncbi:uncharacterized protein A4U43_C05F25710 [Asparagus officinalis]|uniref:Histone-lysine N-methyltransferase n=1 Tax=Asparagus officinalis TaxID=4686 RepID=A0A5P1EYT5_ASPOF|nr:histone-lysine N-methyltransferase ASHR3 [Asparagus officinalis]ONK69689.1 uncharacterized protein A4U43_C05F25710 [Asparagus officinalis]